MQQPTSQPQSIRSQSARSHVRYTSALLTPIVLTLFVAATLVLTGCDSAPTAPNDAGDRGDEALTQATTANAPVEFPFFDQFVDTDFCSGLEHTITVTGTVRAHYNRNNTVLRIERHITTSSGYEGRGGTTTVENGNVNKFTLNDILTHPSGDRIRAHAVIVTDLSAGTVQVLQGGVTCVVDK